MDKEHVGCNGREAGVRWIKRLSCVVGERLGIGIDWSEINKNANDCNGREIGVRWTKSLLDVMGERLE